MKVVIFYYFCAKPTFNWPVKYEQKRKGTCRNERRNR